MNALAIAAKELKDRIQKQGDLPYVSIAEQQKYVDQLCQFPLGKELAIQKSLNTFWTDYIVCHTDLCSEKHSPLEDFILHRSFFTQAWREVLYKTKTLLQANLKEDVTIASIPCGAMHDVLDLDFSELSNYTLIGIDIDPSSLSLAEETAKKKKISEHLKLLQEDAWELPFSNELDIISSCGLNIYEPEEKRILSLYRSFYNALKPGGMLCIGFLTYPPDDSNMSEWKTELMSASDIILEKVIYQDILQMKWRNFKTSDQCLQELKKSGFSSVTIHYDRFHVFPVAIAIK